ncbi:MAG: OmpA family protein [Prevotellaceae bacterium]|jgi:outer membrane protein OmpA-like peptidoglycan-associated protein|nr:OmpA family protein [Prevotellaceae bacterium]
MSKSIKISILAVLTLFCVQTGKVHAQGEYILEGYRHNLALWLGAGYSQLGHNIDQTKVPGGFGGLLGVGYHGSYNGFMFKAGAEFEFLNSKTTLQDFNEVMTYYYTPRPDLQIDYRYTFSSKNFSDVQNVGYVNFPVMVGYRFSDLFYSMLGVKFGLNMLGTYKSQGTFSTTATDPEFIDILENMPNHGIGEGLNLKSSNGQLKFANNIIGSLEVGVYLDKWIYNAPQRRNRQGNYEKRNSYRVALFADYGLADIHKYDLKSLTEDKSIIEYPKEDGYVNPANISTNSVFQSRESFGKKINSMLVGVKFTMLFDLTPDKQIVRPRVVRPRFVAQVVDSETEQGLAAQLLFKNEQGQQVGKVNAARKTGLASRIMREGKYSLDVTLNDYETFSDNVSPSANGDTMLIRLVHKPVLTVKAIDAETQTPLAAEITISEATTGKQVFRTTVDKASGELVRTLEKGDYIVSAAAQGYITNSANVSTEGKKSQIIELNPIKPDVPIVLKNLFFDFNKSTIQPQSEPTLLELYELLKDNPTMKIHIVGHTDNVGTDVYNDKLSLDRAKSIYNEMIKRGVDESRMTFEGKGMREPITTNDTEEGRAENRRVEFTITEK